MCIRDRLGAQHALKRLGHRLEHRDVTASAASGGRHLAADESGSDHMERLSPLEDGKEVLRVGQLPQVDRVTEPIQLPRGRPGRDAEQIPAGAPPAFQHDVAMLEVELGDPRVQKKLDPKLPILPMRAQFQAVSWHRSEQETLGKVRSLVRDLWLRAGEQDLALKARIAEARRGGVPGGTTADDYCFFCNSRTRSSDQPR